MSDNETSTVEAIAQGIDDTTRFVANGATLSGADYLAGVGNTLATALWNGRLPSADDFGINIRAELEKTEQAQCRNPGLQVIGSGVGAIAMGAALAARLAGASAIHAVRTSNFFNPQPMVTLALSPNGAVGRGIVAKTDAPLLSTVLGSVSFPLFSDVVTQLGEASNPFSYAPACKRSR